MWYDFLVNYGIIPDRFLRYVLRSRLQSYSNMVANLEASKLEEVRGQFVTTCDASAIAIETDLANQQHYEIPTLFYEHILSKKMKYSGSFWNKDDVQINDVDDRTLDTYILRAGLQDGSNILDLGAGWGSLSLKIAEHLPNSQITALTNSSVQADYIEEKAHIFGFKNIHVVKSDVQTFNPSDPFDAAVSIEMFEHLRNPRMLMNEIPNWLTSQGSLFIQVFSHRTYPQFFDNFSSSWMAKHFFGGGMMPYDGFYSDISGDLKLSETWRETGISYHHTLESWLRKLDNNRAEILKEANTNNSIIDPKSFINRYRFFLLFCSELFKFNEGNDWYVMNYLFKKNAGT